MCGRSRGSERFVARMGRNRVAGSMSAASRAVPAGPRPTSSPRTVSGPSTGKATLPYLDTLSYARGADGPRREASIEECLLINGAEHDRTVGLIHHQNESAGGKRFKEVVGP